MAKSSKPARIGWDHPLCQRGIVPGYLIQEHFGYSPSSWRKITASWPCCKNLNGEPWFDLEAFKAFLSSPKATVWSKGSEEPATDRIDWDHPAVKNGIAPGYLVQEMLGYSDSYWKKVHPDWTFCKTVNGQQWVSLKGLEAYLATAE